MDEDLIKVLLCSNEKIHLVMIARQLGRQNFSCTNLLRFSTYNCNEILSNRILHSFSKLQNYLLLFFKTEAKKAQHLLTYEPTYSF